MTAENLLVQIALDLALARRNRRAAVAGGGHELKLYGQVDGSDQIGEKDDGALENAHEQRGLAAVILGDLPTQFLHASGNLRTIQENVSHVFTHCCFLRFLNKS